MKQVPIAQIYVFCAISQYLAHRRFPQGNLPAPQLPAQSYRKRKEIHQIP